MPHINIKIEDNTGAEYRGDETVVFIPGKVAIQEGKADSNNCVYISASEWDILKNILDTSSLGTDEAKGTVALIEACLSNNMDVLYHCMSNYSSTNFFPQPTSDGYLFLYDKDNYNVKILTTGYYNALSYKASASEGPQDGGVTFAINGDTSELVRIATIANTRKDCVLITGASCSGEVTKNGDAFANAVKKDVEKISVSSDPKDSVLSYAALLIPDLTTTLTVHAAGDAVYENLKMPSVYAYLQAYGKCVAKGAGWLPIANSERGYVGSYGAPDLTVTKYNMDKNIIVDTEGTSFNGIVNLRPYGNVIWGDRTLLKLTTTVKATAYLSLRLLVCDVAKRAYQSAVRYTYESNNDITWFNFKTRVTELLDEMVAAGVLSTYKMRKQPSKEYNKITCKITLYPNLPVENFDIYINLENAEISTSGEEE